MLSPDARRRILIGVGRGVAVPLLAVAAICGMLAMPTIPQPPEPGARAPHGSGTSDPCPIAALPRPSRPTSSVDGPGLIEIDAPPVPTRCNFPSSLFPWWKERGALHAYSDDPIHEVFGECDASIHSYFEAWLDEQVRDPFNPHLHMAARKAVGTAYYRDLRVSSRWTLAAGELLDEPVDVVTEEETHSLDIQLKVDSLEGASAAQCEPVLETILRRGLRTSGLTTWNGTALPYVMRLTPFNNDVECDTRPWGPDPHVAGSSGREQGLVGRGLITKTGNVYEISNPQAPWSDTVRVDRWGVLVRILLSRNMVDDTYRDRLAAQEKQLAAQEEQLAAREAQLAAQDEEEWSRVLRTTRKYGPD